MITAKIQLNHNLALIASLPLLILRQLEYFLSLSICWALLTLVLRCATLCTRVAVASQAMSQIADDVLCLDDGTTSWLCAEERASFLDSGSMWALTEYARLLRATIESVMTTEGNAS